MKILFAIFAYTNLVYAQPSIKDIELPPGFNITIFADQINGARQMVLGAEGNLFVGTNAGKVYVITPQRKKMIIADGLNSPTGVAFKDGALFVGEIHRIIRFKDIEKNLESPPKFEVIKSFPKDSHHGWKFISFGPDGKLYVPVGAPCNVCDVKEPYASMTRMNSDGTDYEIHAKGIRNTVGFDWHPDSKELWFTDNGRDLLGDDVPPDELNRVTKADQHFGFPFCHGGDLPDPKFGKGKKCLDYSAPEKKLGAHVAALGMCFYQGLQFPANYQKQIFIAEHGSWNRSKKVGYRISVVKLNSDGHAGAYEPFAEGWVKGERVSGRPVDVIVGRDGSLLVSDDFAGVIYKISFAK